MADNHLRNNKAVALLYEQHSLAPRVVAKGHGLIAQSILERAREHDIPISIEPELVELLVQLDLDALIPPQLYAAVAEVLAWAYRVEERLAGNTQEIASPA